jgi:PD-(D/E)XK nuclease superfamily protein
MRTATSLPQIYADSRGLKHADLTGKLIGIFFSVYNELGHGFLESVYEQAISIALAENGLFFQRQIAIPVWFHKQQIGEFRADLLVNEQIILELKTGRDNRFGLGKTGPELFAGNADRSCIVIKFRAASSIQAIRI